MRELLNQIQRAGNDLANLNYQLQLDREALALREATRHRSKSHPRRVKMP